MTHSHSSILNSEIGQLSSYANSLSLPYWDDFKSAYVLGKFNSDMVLSKQWLDGIAHHNTSHE